MTVFLWLLDIWNNIFKKMGKTVLSLNQDGGLVYHDLIVFEKWPLGFPKVKIRDTGTWDLTSVRQLMILQICDFFSNKRKFLQAKNFY